MENLLNALEEWAKISPEAIPPEIRAQISSCGLQLSSAGSQSSPTSPTPVSDGEKNKQRRKLGPPSQTFAAST